MMNIIFLVIVLILVIFIIFFLYQFHVQQKKYPGNYNNVSYIIMVIICLYVLVPILLLRGIIALICYWSGIKSFNIPQILWYFILLTLFVLLRFILNSMDSIVFKYFSVDRIVKITNFIMVLAISINSMVENINIINSIESSTVYAVCITYIALSNAFFNNNDSE